MSFSLVLGAAFLGLVVWLCRRHARLLSLARQFVVIQLSVRRFLRRGMTTADAFAERLALSPHSPAVVFEGRSITFAAVDRASSRVACWALSIGLKPREVVAIVMDNSVDFLVVWLGLAKVGVTVALINTNLRGQPLSHSLRCCDARLVILHQQFVDAFNAIRSELGPTMSVWVHADTAAAAAGTTGSSSTSAAVPSTRSGSLTFPPPEDLTAALASFPDVTQDFAPLRKSAGLNSSDLLFYIFTSGTTGLPKAAKIKHLRWQLIATGFSELFEISKTDRIYNVLPMYHSSGGMVGFACSWYTGATVVLRRKFSASKFFEDCATNDVTVVQYIGQLARYLLATPAGPFDQKHRVRLALGNGLGEDVWDQFRARFAIPRIGEFYASTEGNANLVNNLNIKGVIGWIPPIAKLIYPVRIVRFDTVEEKPVRDANGRCIECAPDETGELLSKIDARDPLRHFDGYTSSRATSEKILTNVFADGDRWFRSGDLVQADAEGLIRFKDRIGDTFRWKGENVATTEVANVISAFQPARGAGIADVNVYGVFVPGHEGRAGMASLQLDGNTGKEFSEADFDFEGFYQYLASQLPSYQSPLFLRLLQKQMDLTSTFKLMKNDLVRDGFDPSQIRDPVFMRDDTQKRYARLDAGLYESICKGRVRV